MLKDSLFSAFSGIFINASNVNNGENVYLCKKG